MEGDAQEIQKRIEQRIGELPADIQTAILSSDLSQKIQSIGSTYKLHVDQIQELHDFTMLVMLGFMNSDEFQKEIINLLQNDSVSAQKVISDVNSQIFLPIRESMKAFAASQVAPEAQAPAAATPAPAPSPTPVAPVSAPAVPMVKTVDMHPADVMLTEKTITTMPAAPAPAVPAVAPKPMEQKAEPPKPQDYKADPYREPIN